jgi:hypothetical protein
LERIPAAMPPAVAAPALPPPRPAATTAPATGRREPAPAAPPVAPPTDEPAEEPERAPAPPPVTAPPPAPIEVAELPAAPPAPVPPPPAPVPVQDVEPPPPPVEPLPVAPRPTAKAREDFELVTEDHHDEDAGYDEHDAGGPPEADAPEADANDPRPASSYIRSPDERRAAVQLWHQLAQAIHRQAPDLRDPADELVPLAVSRDTLFVGLPLTMPADHRQLLLAPATQERLRQMLARLAGHLRLRLVPVIVDISLRERDPRRLAATADAWKRVERHRFVQDVVRAFEGSIVDVRG